MNQKNCFQTDYLSVVVSVQLELMSFRCGRKYFGTFRTTFIIAEDGTVERIIEPKKIKVKDHAAQILD